MARRGRRASSSRPGTRAGAGRRRRRGTSCSRSCRAAVLRTHGSSFVPEPWAVIGRFLHRCLRRTSSHHRCARGADGLAAARIIGSPIRTRGRTHDGRGSVDMPGLLEVEPPGRPCLLEVQDAARHRDLGGRDASRGGCHPPGQARGDPGHRGRAAGRHLPRLCQDLVARRAGPPCPPDPHRDRRRDRRDLPPAERRLRRPGSSAWASWPARWPMACATARPWAFLVGLALAVVGGIGSVLAFEVFAPDLFNPIAIRLVQPAGVRRCRRWLLRPDSC